MEMVYSFVMVITLSFLVVYVITPLIIKFANKIDFLDNPEARKVHKKATPLLGGLSIFIGFFVLALLIIYNVFGNFSKEATGFLIGALIIIFTHRGNIARLLNGTERRLGERVGTPSSPETRDLQGPQTETAG